MTALALRLKRSGHLPVVAAAACTLALLLVGSLYSSNFLTADYLLLQLQIASFLGIVATGGVSSGLDVAKAVALGAVAGGMARPFLQAWTAGGQKAASEQAAQLILEIRVAHLLTGSRTPKDLQQAGIVIGPGLERWLPKDSPLRARLP